MQRSRSGVILLDSTDVICISFFSGCIIAFLYKEYKKLKKRKDKRLIRELKAKSSIIMVSETGTPLKLPLVRGGELVLAKGISLYTRAIKNKKLVALIKAIFMAAQNQKRLKLLQYFLMIFSTVLSKNLGLSFGLATSADYVTIFLLTFPATIGGFVVGVTTGYPLVSALLPLAIFFGRGIEDIPDPSAKCRILCKFAEKFHNQELKVEMEKLIRDASTVVKPQLDGVEHVVCVEQPLSIVQRHKLKELVKTPLARKRVQHFSEFIKKFPECDVIPAEVISEQIARQIKE